MCSALMVMGSIPNVSLFAWLCIMHNLSYMQLSAPSGTLCHIVHQKKFDANYRWTLGFESLMLKIQVQNKRSVWQKYHVEGKVVTVELYTVVVQLASTSFVVVLGVPLLP